MRRRVSVCWPGVLLALLLGTGGCHKFAADSELKQVFDHHRDSFSQLLALAERDRNYPRIHNDLGPPEWRGSEILQYRKLFDTLGLRIGINRYAEFPEAVFFAADAESVWGGGALSKGFVFCKCELKPVVRNTQDALPSNLKDSDGEHFMVFKPLALNWYVFFEFGNGRPHSTRSRD